MATPNSDISEVVLALNEVHGNRDASNRRFLHPVATSFHLAFRVSALVVYLFCTLFVGSFIINFLLVIVLVSMDFWTVKNITGRLMVGLRWWNYVDEQGKSHWVFESLQVEDQNRLSSLEKRIFWGALVMSQLLWVLFLMFSVFSLSLKWIMVVLVSLAMNSANLIGYLRCRFGGKKELSSVAKEFLSQQVVGAVLTNLQSSTSDTTSQPSSSTATQ